MALYKEKESRFGCFEDKLPFIAQVSAAPRQPHAARAPAVQEHGRVWASGMVRMFWFLLLTAHKEVRKHPDYIAALLPWTLTEPVEKSSFMHHHLYSQAHICSAFGPPPQAVLFLGGSTVDPTHCGHFPTICCYFSFLIRWVGLVFFHLFFKPASPKTVTVRRNILLYLTRNDGMTPIIKTKLRVLPWHLKYSKSFPSFSMLCWASKNDYKGSKAYFQQTQRINLVS